AGPGLSLNSLPTRRSSDLGAAADEAAGMFVGQQLGVALEVGRLRRTQDQPLGLDDGALRHAGQNALMPVSSRPITSWCTVSVPSDRKSTRLNSSHVKISYA